MSCCLCFPLIVYLFHLSTNIRVPLTGFFYLCSCFFDYDKRTGITNGCICNKGSPHIHCTQEETYRFFGAAPSHATTAKPNLPYRTSAMLSVKVTTTVPREIINPRRRGLHSIEAFLVLFLASGLYLLPTRLTKNAKNIPRTRTDIMPEQTFICVPSSAAISLFTPLTTCDNDHETGFQLFSRA